MIRRNMRALFLLFFGIIFFPCAVSAQLTLSDLFITDVTPSSFSLVWRTSESATPAVEIFSDAAGTTNITADFRIRTLPLEVADPALPNRHAVWQNQATFRARVRSRTLMKLRVEGGVPGTTYWFRAVATTATETVAWPTTGVSSVTLMEANAFVIGAHALRVRVLNPDPEGWILLADLPGGQYPVTGFVGGGAAVDQTWLNLSQIFGADGRNLQPGGLTTVTVRALTEAGLLFSQPFDLLLGSDFSVAAVHTGDLDASVQPSITLTAPEWDIYTTGESVSIVWEDQAPLSDATISLYFDTDGAGAGKTLIAGGLAENPDGPGDLFEWNTTGLADGVYFLFGEIDNGSTIATSYAPGAVLIDRAGTDGDSDGMADLWENYYFQNLAQTATTDFDLDGSDDLGEFLEQTDPKTPDVRLRLSPGLNLVSFPIEMSPPMDSDELFSRLGLNLSAISRRNPANGQVETTRYGGGAPQGTIFPLTAGVGYYLEMAGAQERLVTGVAATVSHDLAVGESLAGFSGVPRGYKATTLLNRLGAPANDCRVQRFNTISGSFETIGLRNGLPAGPDFPIRRGEAYHMYVISPVTNLSLP